MKIGRIKEVVFFLNHIELEKLVTIQNSIKRKWTRMNNIRQNDSKRKNAKFRNQMILTDFHLHLWCPEAFCPLKYYSNLRSFKPEEVKVAFHVEIRFWSCCTWIRREKKIIVSITNVFSTRSIDPGSFRLISLNSLYLMSFRRHCSKNHKFLRSFEGLHLVRCHFRAPEHFSSCRARLENACIL